MKTRINYLVWILVLCLAFAAISFAACNPDEPDENPDVYTVTYVYGNGEENLTRSVKSGDKAVEPKDPEREGYTFDYWYLSGETSPYDFDAPVTSDITLNAHWTQKTVVPPVTNTYISWNGGSFAEFLIDGESGVVINSVREGEQIDFKLRVSPYAAGTPQVTVSGQTLTADKDGWYSFKAAGAQMLVAVSGLSADSTPITGVGIARDPYVLSTPANFKTFADSVNNANNSKFNGAYVVLANDLSFGGEELEPIGLTLNSAHFSGNFDGRGHTVSDFTMKGKEGLCGLFGYVVTGVVSNVRVANVNYNVDTSQNSNYIVGGIVAYNMGSDITGCTFDGDIKVDLNTLNLNAYVGGIAGFAQGYSTTNSATVSYCTVNGNIISNGKASLLSVGGIAGNIVGTAPSAPMLIYNCSFNGSIGTKIILGGGIVGYMREHASLTNCYSGGNVQANNEYGAAAAGALVGLAEHESAIVNSYSQAEFEARGVSELSGVVKGGIVGYRYLDGDKIVNSFSGVDAREVLILNTYLIKNGQVAEKGAHDAAPAADWTDFTQIKTLLKWNDAEWTFENGKPQALVSDNYGISYTVTFDFDGKTLPDGTSGTDSGEMDTYIPLNWLYEGNGQNTFKATDNSISYGYFLDEERTVRLPSALLLTCDTTVYVGFKDYSAVAGTYYVTDARGNLAKIEFDDNGMMTMTYDGMIARYMYVYDGEKILIKDAYFAYMFYEPGEDSSNLISDFYAEKQGNSLKIYDNYFFCADNSASSYSSVSAYAGNAVMGKWYDAEQSTYTFDLDGTGLKVAKNTTETYFTYTINGKNLSITLGGTVYQATLSDDGRTIETSQGEVLSLDKFDVFAGDWETDFNNRFTVSFDGMGKLTFDGKESVYSVNADGEILFAEGSAVINEYGLIEITYGGNKYVLARAHSYRGTWVDTGIDYTVVFNGIGVDGYGEGFDSQGISFTYTSEKTGEANESGDGYSILLHYRTTLYGLGNHSISKQNEDFILFGVYMNGAGGIWDYINLACLDTLYGEWDNEDGVDFSFNGLGAYDVNMFGDNMHWVAEGEVTVTEGKTSKTVRYYFNRQQNTAEFTYNNVTYTVTVDRQGNAAYAVGGQPAKPLFARDMYADVKLGNAEYTVSFNGKSASGHGEATVSHGGAEQKYVYTLEGSTAKLYKDSVLAYTIVSDEEQNYMVMSGGEQDILLGLYSPISGKSYVGPGGVFVNVEYFDMTGIASGMIFGAEATFMYQSQQQIAVYIEGALTYYLVYVDENNVALFDDSQELITVFVIPDEFRNKYDNADKWLEFDGRSMVEGYYASVTYFDGENEFYYYYKVNQDGTITVFSIDRSGDEDVEIPVFTVYTTQHAGAEEYVSGESTLWVVKAGD